MAKSAYEFVPARASQIRASSDRSVNVVLPAAGDRAGRIDLPDHRAQAVVEIPTHRAGRIVPAVFRSSYSCQVGSNIRASPPLAHEHRVVEQEVGRRAVHRALPSEAVRPVDETAGVGAAHNHLAHAPVRRQPGQHLKPARMALRLGR